MKLFLFGLLLGGYVMKGEGGGGGGGGERSNVPMTNKPPHTTPKITIEKNENIWTVLSKNPAYSGFFNFLKGNSEIREILKDSDRELTVLVPSNSAIMNSGLTLKSAKLDGMLRYHIIDGKVTEEDILTGAYSELPTMLSNDPTLNMRLPSDAVQVITIHAGKLSSGIAPDARVDNSVICTNGIIHTTGTFLIPPQEIPDAVCKTPFNRMLANMRDNISARRGLTFFVPPLGGFQFAMKKASDVRVTNRHVVGDEIIYEGDWKHGSTYRALDGTTLQITEENGKTMINGVPILRTNIPTSFGVAHLIGGGISSLPDGAIIKNGAVDSDKASAVKSAPSAVPVKRKGYSEHLWKIIPASIAILSLLTLIVLFVRHSHGKDEPAISGLS
jgi:uncharacterized surface protein with fasciclin (FAS1) repeats